MLEGTKESALLWYKDDRLLWCNALDNYRMAVLHRADQLSDTNTLVEDDQWLWSADFDDRLSSEQIQRIMKWKLARGKNRPQLAKMVASNSEEAVVEASISAFEEDKTCEDAIKALTVLRGIGPATASACLAARRPERYAFMADEPLECVMGTRKYTLREYLDFNSKLKLKCEIINLKMEDIGKALWVCGQLGFETAVKTRKRKLDTLEDSKQIE